ncbi:hypothetical protein [Pontibacter sp. Tf4]|uniref:hypothetical protein n=1 Tax=Pontibacter sp. Tf4 TaxID=2761620 RepID=UPI002102B2C3|nr:hypothetical protein [Pontibacter sp. Tf4]
MENKTTMPNKSTIWTIGAWAFSILVILIGILNLFLVHPVPGIAYLLISLVFLPPSNTWFRRKFGFSFPLLIKIVLGVVLIMFTLGVSDIGDMIDKL